MRVSVHQSPSNLVVLWTEATQGVRLHYCITAQQLLPDVSPWRWCGTHAEHIWLGRVLPGSAWQQHHTALQTVTRRGQGLLCAQILALTLNADLVPLLYSFFLSSVWAGSQPVIDKWISLKLLQGYFIVKKIDKLTYWTLNCLLITYTIDSCDTQVHNVSYRLSWVLLIYSFIRVRISGLCLNASALLRFSMVLYYPYYTCAVQYYFSPYISHRVLYERYYFLLDALC